MIEMAERLKTARSKAGYTSARSACEARGWVYTTYAGHENGSVGFKRTADRYAQAFGVSLEWLMTGRGQMKKFDPTIEEEILQLWGRIPSDQKETARIVLMALAEKN